MVKHFPPRLAWGKIEPRARESFVQEWPIPIGLFPSLSLQWPPCDRTGWALDLGFAQLLAAQMSAVERPMIIGLVWPVLPCVAQAVIETWLPIAT